MSNARKATPQPVEFDWDALVAEPKRATTSAQLCFRSDLNARHQELSAELAAMTKGVQDRRLGQVDPRALVAEQVRELEEQMRDATQSVDLQAMRRPDFRTLLADHPPRKGQQLDTAYGVNIESAFPVLLAECATSPKRDAEFWSKMLDEVLNDGQYEKLVIAAWNVNRADVAAPFSQLASAVTKTSNGSSPPPTG